MKVRNAKKSEVEEVEKLSNPSIQRGGLPVSCQHCGCDPWYAILDCLAMSHRMNMYRDQPSLHAVCMRMLLSPVACFFRTRKVSLDRNGHVAYTTLGKNPLPWPKQI